MPTYEYVCPKCGVFEQFHSITVTLSDCPKCGSTIHRLISQNSNIIFKGSGFHTTDYRSSDYQKKATNESSTTTSTSSSSSESKAKNESKAS